MKRSIVFKSVLFCMLAGVLLHSKLYSTSLNGTAGIVYQNQHYVFRDGDIAQGFVRLNGGFTILPGAQATMDLVASVSSGINLRETGELQLFNDLVLDSGVTFSAGGYLNGRSHALDFRGTFTMPYYQVLHIVSDTTIDGKGGTLLFSPNSHLFVEQNATLTLRNMHIHSTRNNPLMPIFRCSGNSSRIALDNVTVGLSEDFVFNKGRLFIHNDVMVTGTHTFIYKSPMPLLVDSSAILTFDIGTGFSFAPTSTDQRLFVLKDATSSLFFNGSTFSTTSTGARFTKGNIFFDNKIVLNSQTNVEVDNITTAVTSTHYGLLWEAMAWRPDGKHLIVGGSRANQNGTGINNQRDTVVLYHLSGSNLVTVTSQSFGNSAAAHVFGLDWSSDGQFVAVSGERGEAGLGGFSTTANVRIYKFTGSVLSPIDSVLFPNYGSDSTHARWRPDQRFLTVSGENPGLGDVDFLIYRFDGTSLSLTTSLQYSAAASCLDHSWSPDGKFIALVGASPVSGGSSGFANTDQIRIYSFNGSSLTPVTSQAYGTFATGVVFDVAWSPDGKFLLVAGTGATATGGFANTHRVRVYAFNGTSLMAQASFDGSRPSTWHPDGQYVACRNSAGTDIQILKFTGSGLLAVNALTLTTNNFDFGWDPTGAFFTYGTEFVNLNSTGLTNPLAQQFSKAIIFGDSDAGIDFNCNVEVLGGAHVTVNGVANDDSV